LIGDSKYPIFLQFGCFKGPQKCQKTRDTLSWPLPLCVQDALQHHGTSARLTSTGCPPARSPTHLTAHKGRADGHQINPGGRQRRRPGVGSYQSFRLCRGGGAGKQGSVAGTAEGLLCTRHIGLATQARWSSSQTTRLPQAQSQLHETWHNKYYAEQVRPLTCCVQPERSSIQVNEVEFRSCLANQTKR